MPSKKISQIVTDKGQPAAPATSAPGWFVSDGVRPGAADLAKDVAWGKVFSEPKPGNEVDFYSTGETYFTAVAAAISGAKKCVFIAGWQVNFDVQLTNSKTLFQCLKDAVDGGATVYVMPWLSPKMGLDTGDFETMLAVAQLNAGRPAPRVAHVLPAVSQSDMTGALDIGFSHHQKLVVIDNERAFVGGIDLAYGRRDDANFSLQGGARVGNELYNSCVPSIRTIPNTEQTNYLTRAEMLAACFDGTGSGLAQWATSSPDALAKTWDVSGSASKYAKDRAKELSDAWNNADLTPDFVKAVDDKMVDAFQSLSKWGWKRLDEFTRGKLEKLRETGSANAADAAAAVLAWLNNASLEQLPPRLLSSVGKAIEALNIAVAGALANQADLRKEIYPGLLKLGKVLPKSGTTIDPKVQPRMPWQDVHSSIRGPAVHELSRNFVRRWNGMAGRYEASYAAVTDPTIKSILASIGIPLKKPNIARIASSHRSIKNDAFKPGKCWVQVLRSAPIRMLKDEAVAEADIEGSIAQNNCKKAMYHAIGSAQNFIYIEGQFFQSNYGDDLPIARDKVAGPMQSMLDISRSPSYRKYAKMLEIEGVEPKDIPSKIRWAKVDDVFRDIKGGGGEFMADLTSVLKSLSSIEASKAMGMPVKEIRNVMAGALVNRIEQAIYDCRPFHVYLVLPVHPEGTLNTLNIMTQIHLTMQSLVFGSKSLVNEIRRAILEEDYRQKITTPMTMKQKIEQAAKEVTAIPLDARAAAVGARWQDYLTLLNLRNWDTIGGRPVTEQIYVHSKLIIVDDRIALLGSANINDRSTMGDRDSELLTIVFEENDKSAAKVKLDGVNPVDVSAGVHNLRVDLWKKIFGLSGGIRPASTLTPFLTQPANPKTWKEIQRIAASNLKRYSDSFKYIPAPAKTNEFGPRAMGGSIWPTWSGDKLVHRMPFNEGFWRDLGPRDQQFSWDAATRAPESAPGGIEGFFIALPTNWTYAENNISGMNLTLLANLDPKLRVPGRGNAESLLASNPVSAPSDAEVG
jgi:phospholipase D1/2